MNKDLSQNQGKNGPVKKARSSPKGTIATKQFLQGTLNFEKEREEQSAMGFEKFLHAKKYQTPKNHYSRVQEKARKEAENYINRQTNIDAHIADQIEQNKIQWQKSLKIDEKIKKMRAEERAKRKEEAEKRGGTFAQTSELQEQIERELEEQNKIKTESYVPSRDAQMTAAKMAEKKVVDDLKAEITKQRQELLNRTQRLAEYNKQKVEYSSKLIDTMAFVKDLQRATTEQCASDLNTIADLQLQQEYEKEQEIHKKLDDQMIRAQQEHQQLVERLSLFSGDKEIVVTEQDGNKKTFKVTAVSIQTLKDEIDSLTQQIQKQTILIDQQKEKFDLYQKELHKCADVMDRFNCERKTILAKSTEFEVRYDQAQISLNLEKERLQNMHKLHLKLLSARQQIESLQKFMAKSKAQALNLIKDYAEQQKIKVRAATQIRHILIRKQNKIMKRLFANWFKSTFEPTQTKQLTKQIPRYFMKQVTLKDAFHSWRTLFLQRTFQRHLKHKTCRYFMEKTQKNWLKICKVFLMVWRNRINSQRDKLVTLRKYLINSENKLMHQNISIWKTFKDNQDFSVRMHYLITQLCQKQVMARVLFEIKDINLKKRVKNNQRKVRTLLTLGNNSDANKFLKWAKKFENKFILPEAKKLIAQRIFNYFRYYKTLQHLKLKEKRELFLRKQALRCCIINPMMKKIARRFQFWKTYVERYKKWKNDNFRIYVIHKYQQKILDGLSWWKFGVTHKIIAKEHENLQNVIDQQGITKRAIFDAQAKIKDWQQNSLFRARNVTRRIILQSYKRYIFEKMQQWQKEAKIKTKTEYWAQRLLTRAKNGFLKLWLDRWRRISDEIKTELKCDQEIEVQRQKANFALLRQTFEALSDYQLGCIERRQSIIRVLNAQARAGLQRMLCKWRFVTRSDAIKLVQQKQRTCINELQALTINLSNESQTLFEIETIVKSLLQTQQTLKCKTVQKWMFRCLNETAKYGFKQWCQRDQEIKLLKRYVTTMLNGNKKAFQTKVFAKIVSSVHIENKMKILALIEKENQKIQSEQGKTKLQLQQHELLEDKLKSDSRVVQTQVKLRVKKFNQNVQMIRVKAQNFHFYSRLRSVFNKLKEGLRQQKFQRETLSKAVYKLFGQYAFNQIREEANEEKQFQKRKAVCKKLHKIKQRQITEYVFQTFITNFTREQKRETEIAETQTKIEIQSHKQFLQSMKLYHSAEVRRSFDQKLLFKCFQFMRYKTFNQRYQKKIEQERIEKFYILQRKRCLLKWAQRTKITIKTRSDVDRYIKRYHTSLLKKAFVRGFKQNQQNERQIANVLDKVGHFLKLHNHSYAFGAIKYCSQNNHQKSIQQNQQALRVLAIKFELLLKNRLRHGLMTLNKFDKVHEYRYRRFKAFCLNRIHNATRSNFLKWARHTQKIRIVEFNEELDGKRNLEAWMWRWKLHNHYKMVIDSGNSQHDLKQIQEEAEDKQFQLMQKSVIRLMINQDDDLKLMPVYFEKLKNYTKVRQLWRYHLEKWNKRADPDKNIAQKLVVFRVWKNRVEQAKEALDAISYPDLKVKNDLNNRKMQVLADSLTEKVEILNEYTVQKDCLFEGTVIAKKLALSVSNASYERCQFKTISQFQQVGHQQVNRQISEALQQNLDRIDQLKNRVAILENQNSVLADQHDLTRGNALKTVQQARQVEALKKDNDSLTNEIRSNNKYISSLMMDNQWLHGKVKEFESRLNQAAITSASRPNQSEFKHHYSHNNYRQGF